MYFEHSLQVMESLATMAVYLLTISIGGLIEGIDASCNQCVNFKSQLGKNTVENKALFEHTFLSTTRFNNFQNCFFACAGDCRCMSYNFQTRPSSDGSQLCELNSADAGNRPDLLKGRPGFSYHDIVPEFNFGQVRIKQSPFIFSYQLSSSERPKSLTFAKMSKMDVITEKYITEKRFSFT